MPIHRVKHARTLSLIAFILFGCMAAPAAPTPAPSERKGITYKNTVVSLTFDDGDADNYEVRATLRENELRATFYVSSELMNTPAYMTEEQLKGLNADGNEIGGHTLTHIKLSEVSGFELKRQVCQDRINLLNYGFEVTSFAYPNGYYDDQSKQVVEDCGYNSARIVTDGPEVIPATDRYALQAMPYIVDDTTFSKMFRYVQQVEIEGGGWAIFVFHHVCTGCDKFAVDLETFSRFAVWLNNQQKNNGLVIKTVNEVVGGETQEGVAP
jgi:peptidoglycan/xylan/chitin deacetylase (PgdA/CDA1 family)